jgi:hypothetical protein
VCDGIGALGGADDGSALMVVPEVGARVVVRYSGVVRESSDDRRGGFWLTVPADALLRTPETSSWVPPAASVEVLSPPLPDEVLLLECGHVSGGPRPPSPSDSIWCYTCDNRHPLRAIGGVTWGRGA